MDLIKLLDVSNPKKIKDTVNLLISNYEGFDDEIRTTAQQALNTATSANVTALQAQGQVEENKALVTSANQISTEAKQISEEALAMIEAADKRSEEATTLAEQAIATAESADQTSELAMNVATEAKSTVDTAVSTGVFGTFVYGTNSVALQRAYATDDLLQENTEEREYLATPKLVRDALLDYYDKTTIDELEIELQDKLDAINTDLTSAKEDIAKKFDKLPYQYIKEVYPVMPSGFGSPYPTRICQIPVSPYASYAFIVRILCNASNGFDACVSQHTVFIKKMSPNEHPQIVSLDDGYFSAPLRVVDHNNSLDLYLASTGSNYYVFELFCDPHNTKQSGGEPVFYMEQVDNIPSGALAPTRFTGSNKALISALTTTVNTLTTKIDTLDIPKALADLTEDATHRTVTDTEKNAWNSKPTLSEINEILAGYLPLTGGTVTGETTFNSYVQFKDAILASQYIKFKRELYVSDPETTSSYPYSDALKIFTAYNYGGISTTLKQGTYNPLQDNPVIAYVKPGVGIQTDLSSNYVGYADFGKNGGFVFKPSPYELGRTPSNFLYMTAYRSNTGSEPADDSGLKLFAITPSMLDSGEYPYSAITFGSRFKALSNTHTMLPYVTVDGGEMHVNGKLFVNPSASDLDDLFNEGIVVAQAKNGWSELVLGAAAGNLSNLSGDSWVIARRGASGATSGGAGDLTLEYNGSGGTGLTLYKNGNNPTWRGKKLITIEDLKRFFGRNQAPFAAWLFNGSAGGGTINLAASWENYDMLMVLLTHDNSTCAGVYFMPTWVIKYARDYQASVNNDGFLLASQGSVYWYLNRAGSGTSLQCRTENSVIKQIVGINWN